MRRSAAVEARARRDWVEGILATFETLTVGNWPATAPHRCPLLDLLTEQTAAIQFPRRLRSKPNDRRTLLDRMFVDPSTGMGLSSGS
jgi:hypothetical protein